MFAGTEIRVDGDPCKAEERDFDTMQPTPTPCASALGVNGQLGAEPPLEVKGAQWESISAQLMPSRIMNEKEEHRHLIADFDFPFNLLVAEPVSKTQRKTTSQSPGSLRQRRGQADVEDYLGPYDCQIMVVGITQVQDYWNQSSCSEDF